MDKYKVIEIIGEGSFGRVFRATEKQTGNTVALKLIPKVSHSDREISSMRSEFKIQKELSHPNIVRILDGFETDKELISVAEFIPGELYRLFDQYKVEMGYRRLPEERVQELCGDLLSALYYLHSNRILHRDIKPQNILLDNEGRAKLCDFGFARNLGINTHVLTSIKGTPLYMAPELIEEKPYDHTADIWSLGCIIYELLCGQPPFSTSSLFKLISKIRYESIQWPAHLSENARSFLQGVLEKESKRRLSWPDLAHHPFVQGRVLATGGKEIQPLTVILSESQELAKEMQRQDKSKLLSGNSQTLIRVAQKHEAQKQQLAAFTRNLELQQRKSGNSYAQSVGPPRAGGSRHNRRRFSDIGQATNSALLLGKHNPDRRLSDAVLPGNMIDTQVLRPLQPLPNIVHPYLNPNKPTTNNHQPSFNPGSQQALLNPSAPTGGLMSPDGQMPYQLQQQQYFPRMQQIQCQNPAISVYQQPPYRGGSFGPDTQNPMATQIGLHSSSGMVYNSALQRPMPHGANQYQPYLNQVPTTNYSSAAFIQQNSPAYHNQCLQAKLNRPQIFTEVLAVPTSGITSPRTAAAAPQMAYNNQAFNQHAASNFPMHKFNSPRAINNAAMISNPPTKTQALNIVPKQMAVYSQPITAIQTTAYSTSLAAAQTAFSKPVTAADNVQYHPLILQPQTQQNENLSEKPTNPAVAKLTDNLTTASVDSNVTIKNANNDTSGDEEDLENQEWLEFLDSQILETLENPSAISNKNLLEMIIAPIKSTQEASSEVILKTLKLLSLPFVNWSVEICEESSSYINLLLPCGVCQVLTNIIMHSLEKDDEELTETSLELLIKLILLSEQAVTDFCESVITSTEFFQTLLNSKSLDIQNDGLSLLVRLISSLSECCVPDSSLFMQLINNSESNDIIEKSILCLLQIKVHQPTIENPSEEVKIPREVYEEKCVTILENLSVN